MSKYPNRGRPLDPIHRQHISEALKGNKNKLGTHHSEETKSKIGAAHKGMKHTEETKAIIKEKRKLQVCTPETRAKMSASRTGERNPNYGKTITDERRKYLSEINSGENNPHFGTHLTDETKEKIRQSHIGENNYNYGIPHTPEHKRKISCAISKEKNPNWRGGISFGKYCPKFDFKLKENVRNFCGGRCVVPDCGKDREGNKGERLSVHHVFTEKMTCCETKIEDMEEVRKRLPKHIARFGEPTFSDLEILYIRMMVPLCRSHHSYAEGEKLDLPFEQTKYRKQFTEFLMQNFNGRCYNDKDVNVDEKYKDGVK